jgi:hypothetical protein
MAFAKLKALLRARAVRTIDALWRAIGEICDLFSPQKCQNYFHAAGYVLIPEEAAPQFLDEAAPRNGMMPPPDSEMIAPPIAE